MVKRALRYWKSNAENALSIDSKTVLRPFDDIYREIDEYNRTFMSKFLFIVWHIFGSIIVICLYNVLFIRMNIYLNISLVYLLIVWLSFFLFIIFIASSVNYESNRTYIILNSLYVHYNTNTIPKFKCRLSFNVKVK